MSTMTENDALSATLFGKTRRAILRLLLGHTNESFYLRQIARLTGAGLGAVQRELKRLADAGIVSRNVQGRQVYFRVNLGCPVYPQLRSLLGAEAPSMPPAPQVLAGRRAEGNITVPHAKLAEFCQRHHITKLAFFGSVLRDDFRPDSDVDILVEFDPGHVPGFFRLSDMEAELALLLGGRKVDLRTREDLSRHFRERVVREAEVEYAKAG